MVIAKLSNNLRLEEGNLETVKEWENEKGEKV